MKNRFTRAGLAAILKNAEYWLKNPLDLKTILCNEIVTAELVRQHTDRIQKTQD